MLAPARPQAEQLECTPCPSSLLRLKLLESAPGPCVELPTLEVSPANQDIVPVLTASHMQLVAKEDLASFA